MRTRLPPEEIRRRLSWVEFLAPLSEHELDDLLRGASFLELEKGEKLIIGPEEHAQRMLLPVSGQLQVYEVSLSSGREHTLWVLGSGQAVGTTGLIPRWTRELHIRALEPSVVCRVPRSYVEALVRSKPEGIPLAAEPDAPQEAEVVDLVAALRASVEAAKKRREETERAKAI